MAATWGMMQTQLRQYAGAFYGESGIPSRWMERLALRGVIRSLAEQMYLRDQHV